jgi:hypothetical protein
MRQVQCKKCGGLYVVIAEDEAYQIIAEANARSVARGLVPNATMDSFFKCFHCSAPSISFVNAPDHEVLAGCALAPVVIAVPNRQQGTGNTRDQRNASKTINKQNPSAVYEDTSGRTYLNVPYETREFAKRHGASFDKILRTWYVQGEVPLELTNFLPQEPRVRAHVVAPVCPRCGCSTVLRTETKDGSWFYGCSGYRTTRCRGTVDYDNRLAAIGVDGDTSAIASLRRIAYEKSEKPSKHIPLKAQLDVSHQEAIAELAKLGVNVFGDQIKFMGWLVGPKRTFDGKTPTQEMQTLEGCERVKQLLLGLQ